MGNVSLLNGFVNALQGLPPKDNYCATEMENVERNESHILSNPELTETERALLEKMNVLAKQSVQLNCGLFKPEVYNYCEKGAEQIGRNEASIKAAPLNDTERKLLLEMNSNARKSLALNCGE